MCDATERSPGSVEGGQDARRAAGKEEEELVGVSAALSSSFSALRGCVPCVEMDACVCDGCVR
eukprot:557289-Rhodomonas_salina.1